MLRNLLSSVLLGMFLIGTSVEAGYGKKGHGSAEKSETKGPKDRSGREGGEKHKKSVNRNGKCIQKQGCSKKSSERNDCGMHRKDCGKKRSDSQ